MARSVEQQLIDLGKLGRGQLLSGVVWGASVGALLMAGLAWHLQQPWYGFGAAVLSIVVLAGAVTGPHIRRAARAIAGDSPVAGQIHLRKDPWSDGAGMIGLVQAGPAWWALSLGELPGRSTEGAVNAKLYYAADVAWPCAIVTDQAVLHPRSRPRLLAASTLAEAERLLRDGHGG